jgi:DtxR family Mn-dependent transcriptional regulator
MARSGSATVDKYLEAIFYIAGEGEVVRPGRLAGWLAVSPPTVSEALNRLQRDKWIKIKKDRSVTLTASGLTYASNLVRHHRILERWLTDVLGLDWASADEEADRLSSAISDLLIDRIDASLQRPLTCPHGNPIPGRAAPYGTLVTLSSIEDSTSATIRRISEVAEHEARTLLGMLALHGICEGCDVTVVARHDATQELELVVGETKVTLPITAADLIWVEPTTQR